MKKILVMIMMILLCACAGQEFVTNSKAEISSVEIAEEALGYISDHYSLRREYYVGDGVKTLIVNEDGKIADGETEVFPVYYNDDILFMVLAKEGECRFVEPSDAMAAIIRNNKYLIFEVSGNVFYLSQDEFLMIDGDKKFVIPEDMNALISKKYDGKFIDNPMGEERVIIKTKKPIDGGEQKDPVGDDHIIVRFKEGDREKQIADYEAFCNGNVDVNDPNNEIYIFYFDKLSLPELNKLVEESNKLDYVEIAQLDQQNELIDPVKVNE
jgi:hypothetical protein